MIYVDNGYGRRKLLVNDQQIIFSSFVGEYQESKSDFDTQDLSIRVAGLGEWSFGHTARLQSSIADRSRSSDWIFEGDYLAGMLLGISMGYDDKPTTYIPTDIITGLPGHDYQKDNDFIQAFKDHIAGKYSVQRGDLSQTIEIKNVYVTSQAYGPVFLHIIGSDGKFIKPDVPGNKLRFATINSGYNTLETSEVEVNINGNGKLIPRPAKGFEESTLDGVHILINRYQDELRRKYRQRFNVNQTIDIIETGGFWFNGQWQEFNPVEIKKEYAQKIEKVISNVWGDDYLKLYRIIITGGGANIVRGLLKYPQVIISDDPQWDIVRGYERLAKAR